MIATLRRHLQAAYGNATVQERMAAAGIDPLWLEGGAAVKRMESDLTKWGAVIRTANIKLE